MFKRANIVFFVIGILFITGCNSGEKVLRSDIHFGVGIEQDGKQIPIKNNSLEIKRKPFTLVFYFPKHDGVSVNASFNQKSYDSAKNGVPLKNIIGFSETGMAEYDYNKHERIFIYDKGPHYWYFKEKGEHRFSEITKKDKFWVCKRVVSNIQKEKVDIALNKTTESSLYFVFIKYDWGQNYSKIERQRECLKIQFKQ